jgi:UDP-N-acetylglucosamine--N-acetylmuramyl-(pentapeptide) pyrophosphoryl-undecaprenol N-acetylglucosamine transferase
MARKVVLAGGGTGGHVFMGIAIAREFLRRDPAAQICFIGTRQGLESKIVTSEGFRLEFIEVGGLKRMGFKKFFANAVRVPKSLLQSGRLLRRLRPDVVIGVGGYSSGPVLLVAALGRIPTLIVEPNAIPGITNRILAFFVQRAAVAFSEATRYLRGKAVETGIPIRSDFFQIVPKPREAVFSILIFGGSQGSHAINLAMCEALPLLRARKDALRIVHQTGEADYAMVCQAYNHAGMNADVRVFIDDMPDEFGKADLIISRAGASTIAELTAAGKTALLIPLPTAADDHQRKNAEALVRKEAALMVVQPELSGARLAEELIRLIERPEAITRMEAASRRLGRPDATERIVDLAMTMR